MWTDCQWGWDSNHQGKRSGQLTDMCNIFVWVWNQYHPLTNLLGGMWFEEVQRGGHPLWWCQQWFLSICEKRHLAPLSKLIDWLALKEMPKWTNFFGYGKGIRSLINKAKPDSGTGQMFCSREIQERVKKLLSWHDVFSGNSKAGKFNLLLAKLTFLGV